MKVVNFVIKSTEGYPVDVVMEKLPVTVSFSAEFGIYEPRDTFTLKTQILSPEGVILVDTESEMETSENANAVHLFLDVNEMPIETEGEYKILIIADNESIVYSIYGSGATVYNIRERAAFLSFLDGII